MSWVSYYLEFGDETTKSLLDHIGEEEIPGKKIIMDYFSKAEKKAIACHTLFDHVKNKSTGDNVFLFSDGEFEWNSEDVYHFEKYNMELEQGFINKVLKEKK